MKKPAMPKEPERKMVEKIWEVKCEFYKDYDSFDDEDEAENYNCSGVRRNAGLDCNFCDSCEDGEIRPYKVNLIDILNKYKDFDINDLQIEAEGDSYFSIHFPEP